MMIVEICVDCVFVVLLLYQQKWCVDMLFVKVCEKLCCVGLFWGEVVDLVLFVVSQCGMDVWYVGYNKDMVQEFIWDCVDWVKFYSFVVDEIEEIEEVFQDKDGDKLIFVFVICFVLGFCVMVLLLCLFNLCGK